MTASPFRDAKEHLHFIPAPKAGSTDAASDGSIQKKNVTAAAVVEFDLSAWVGRWCAIRSETADIGWFARPPGSTVDPLLTARTNSNPGRQCARQLADDPRDPFFVEPGWTEIAVIGSASGVCTVSLVDTSVP